MKVGFPHFSPSTGGPGTFQNHISNVLQRSGHQVVFPSNKVVPDIILVIGGTVRLAWLLLCKSHGTKIVHRLDGLNWRQDVGFLPIKDRLLCNVRNRLMWFIRKYFADHVVYQSKFVRDWWHRIYGQANCAESIIYNGTDLSKFIPAKKDVSRVISPSLLCVEGNLHDDPITIKILTTVTEQLIKDGTIGIMLLCGGVPAKAHDQLNNIQGIRLLGNISRDTIQTVFANADVFLNLEINPPCPNSVIEALASGLPVVGFDTGSLSELVPPEAGMVVPYCGNPWKLELPDIFFLENGVRKVLSGLDDYSKAARSVAEQRFGLDKMLKSYLAVFENVLARKK